MEILILPQEFSVCQLSTLQGFDSKQDLFFLAKTKDEISLICESGRVPACAQRVESGYRGFYIDGVLDFSFVGILARVAGKLAGEDISLLSVATYNTDYFFVKADKLDKAVKCLTDNGYVVKKK